MIARDIMTEDPYTVGPDDSVRTAINLQLENDIRHVPVVDEDNKLVGMLSDRDLRDATLPVWTGFEHPDQAREALDASVSDIMQADIISCSAEDELADVIDQIIDHKIGALPVIDDESGRLVGIISYIDVLRAVRDDM